MSWCFKQVCQARPRIATCQKSVLNYSPKPVEISVHRPRIASRTSWKIFSRKCWFIKTQTFRGNRPVLMKGFSAPRGRNLKTEAGRQARLLEEAPAQWLSRLPKTWKIKIRICNPSQANEGLQLVPPHPQEAASDHQAISAALGNGSLSQKICSFFVQSPKKVKVMEIFTGPGKSPFSQLTHQ